MHDDRAVRGGQGEVALLPKLPVEIGTEIARTKQIEGTGQVSPKVSLDQDGDGLCHRGMRGHREGLEGWRHQAVRLRHGKRVVGIVQPFLPDGTKAGDHAILGVGDLQSLAETEQELVLLLQRYLDATLVDRLACEVSGAGPQEFMGVAQFSVNRLDHAPGQLDLLAADGRLRQPFKLVGEPQQQERGQNDKGDDSESRKSWRKALPLGISRLSPEHRLRLAELGFRRQPELCPARCPLAHGRLSARRTAGRAHATRLRSGDGPCVARKGSRSALCNDS